MGDSAGFSHARLRMDESRDAAATGRNQAGLVVFNNLLICKTDARVLCEDGGLNRSSTSVVDDQAVTDSRFGDEQFGLGGVRLQFFAQITDIHAQGGGFFNVG